MLKKFIVCTTMLSSTIGYSQKRVLVIDTGASPLNLCKDGNIDLTDTTLFDRSEHGKVIVDILNKNLPSGYCVNMIKYYDSEDLQADSYKLYNAVNSYIEKYKPDAINMSYTNENKDVYEEEFLTNVKTPTFIAAGNSGEKIKCKNFLACGNLSKFVHYISTNAPESNVYPWSEFLIPHNRTEENHVAQGTSLAVPYFISRFLNK